MSDLQTRFQAAVEAAPKLAKRPDNDTMLKLYALYKQATAGDASGPRPGVFDMIGRTKFDAWAKMKGTSAESAMEAYVALVEQLKSA